MMILNNYSKRNGSEFTVMASEYWTFFDFLYKKEDGPKNQIGIEKAFGAFLESEGFHKFIGCNVKNIGEGLPFLCYRKTGKIDLYYEGMKIINGRDYPLDGYEPYLEFNFNPRKESKFCVHSKLKKEGTWEMEIIDDILEIMYPKKIGDITMELSRDDENTLCVTPTTHVYSVLGDAKWAYNKLRGEKFQELKGLKRAVDSNSNEDIPKCVREEMQKQYVLNILKSLDKWPSFNGKAL